MDWTASEELKEVLIKWIDYAEIEENSEKLTSQEKWQLIDIKFIDLDTKPYWEFLKRSNKLYERFADYLKIKFDRMNISEII